MLGRNIGGERSRRERIEAQVSIQAAQNFGSAFAKGKQGRLEVIRGKCGGLLLQKRW